MLWITDVMFQFLIGTVKTSSFADGLIEIKKFQFLIGTVKTFMGDSGDGVFMGFNSS